MVVIPQTIKDFFSKVSEYYQPEETDQTPSIDLTPPPPPPRVNRPDVDKPELEARVVKETPSTGGGDLGKVVSWVFGMISAAGSALYSCAFQQETDADQARLDQVKAQINRLRADMNALGQDHPEIHAELSKIVDGHVRFLEEKSIHARTVTLLSGSGLVCAAAGIIAGLFVIKWLLTAALVVGLCISVLSIYNYCQRLDKPGDVKQLIDTFQFKEQMA
jgi:hypothetical protein